MVYNNSSSAQAIRQVEHTLKSYACNESTRIKSKVWDIEKMYKLELLQHEIKTPLTTLFMLVAAIQPKDKIALEHIQTNIQQIREVLTSNVIVEKCEEFDLVQLIKECAIIARIRDYRIDITPIYESIIIKGNSCKFRQILINIFSNARESTRDNSKRVQIKIKRESNWDHVEVQNTFDLGRTTMSNEYSIGTSKKLSDENRGLGIALCRKFMEQDFSGTLQTILTRNNTFSVILKFPRIRSDNV